MGFYYVVDDKTGRVMLSKGTRVALANLRKQGFQPGQIGNAGLAAGENAKAVGAMVAYAAAVKNTQRVNAYWGK